MLKPDPAPVISLVQGAEVAQVGKAHEKKVHVSRGYVAGREVEKCNGRERWDGEGRPVHAQVEDDRAQEVAHPERVRASQEMR